MNEKLKAKLEQAKGLAKKHAPEIISVALGVVGAIGWGLAGHYKNELDKLQTVDPNAWPTIEVPPNVMKDVRNGATMKYREAQIGSSWYAQSTSLDDFPDQANAEWKRFKETGNLEDE